MDIQLLKSFYDKFDLNTEDRITIPHDILEWFKTRADSDQDLTIFGAILMSMLTDTESDSKTILKDKLIWVTYHYHYPLYFYRACT